MNNPLIIRAKKIIENNPIKSHEEGAEFKDAIKWLQDIKNWETEQIKKIEIYKQIKLDYEKANDINEYVFKLENFIENFIENLIDL